MTTITIPQKLSSNKELVAVPRDIYEDFLAWQEVVKSRKTFKPTSVEKKAINRGRREISKGQYTTLENLIYELGGKNR